MDWFFYIRNLRCERVKTIIRVENMFKACVRYFLSNFYFILFFDSPLNTKICFLFHLKSSNRSRDIQISVFFSLPFHTFQIQKDKWKWNNL